MPANDMPMILSTFLLAATVSSVPELTAFKPGETVLTDSIVRERIETCASNILHHLKVEESFVKPFRDCDSKDTWRFVGCGMLLDALVKGSEVMLSSGIYGKIDAVEAETFIVEIAPGMKIKVAKNGVAGAVEAKKEETK